MRLSQPLLLTVRDLIDKFQSGESVRLCNVGCSSGAEMYSLLWTIRSARPDLRIFPLVLDISELAIEKAKAGRYSRCGWELRRRLSEETMLDLFEYDGEQFAIHKWIAQGVEWRVGDARDPQIIASLGLQDILLANNFLIHMEKDEATACFYQLAQLVKPGGFLVCRGMDLDIREQAAQDLLLQPVLTRIEEIHDADSDLDARCGWPWRYWGLVPMDKSRNQWMRRYSSIFQVPAARH